MAQVTNRFSPRLARRKMIGGTFYVVFLAAVMVSIASLFVLLAQTAVEGIPWLDFDFLTSYMSRKPELAGIKAAVMGTIVTIVFTALFTVPVGVGAAIYLEEYAPKNRLTQIIEINISNLAGVPSVVYGLLGLGVFVQLMSLGKVVLAGALTLGLLVLPIVILASREAIRAVPNEYRLGAFALGADQWQVIKGTVLPSALPGNTDRHHPGTLEGRRRSRADSRHKRTGVRDVRTRPPGQVHRTAPADIHLGRSPAGRVQVARRGGYHRSTGDPALDERSRRAPPQQVPDKIRGLVT